MEKWESWRYQIDRSTREAELTGSRRAPRLREWELTHERPEHRETKHLGRSAEWFLRFAQAAAGWFL